MESQNQTDPLLVIKQLIRELISNLSRINDRRVGEDVVAMMRRPSNAVRAAITEVARLQTNGTHEVTYLIPENTFAGSLAIFACNIGPKQETRLEESRWSITFAITADGRVLVQG